VPFFPICNKSGGAQKLPRPCVGYGLLNLAEQSFMRIHLTNGEAQRRRQLLGHCIDFVSNLEIGSAPQMPPLPDYLVDWK
jgi:hypothetical protein